MTNGKQNAADSSGASEANPKRRMRRGKLVFVEGRRRDNPRSAELDPEATRSTDQTLTEISLKSANSDSNATILRDHEKTHDRFEHIKSGLAAKQKDVLLKVLEAEPESGESLREVAAKAGLHAPQVSRAFRAAREADKRQIFKRSDRQKPAYKPYNPPCVPMERVMMPHQGPILFTITAPDRRIGTAPIMTKIPAPKTPMALDLSGLQIGSQSAPTKSPVGSGPESQSHVVAWLPELDTRSRPSSLSGESNFGKLKQLFSSCFQWVRGKFTAFFG